MGRAHPGEFGGELIEIGLADDNGACGLQQRNDSRILRRRVGIVWAGSRCRHARHIDVVLHREGDAPQGPRDGIKCAQRFHLGNKHRLLCQMQENAGITRVTDTLEYRVDHLKGRNTCCICCVEASDIETQIAHDGLPPARKITGRSH